MNFRVKYRHSVSRGAKDTSLLSVVTDSQVEDSMVIFKLISSVMQENNSVHSSIQDFLSFAQAKLEQLLEKKKQLQEDYDRETFEKDKERDMKLFQYYFKVIYMKV